jgi:hypothetical protein
METKWKVVGMKHELSNGYVLSVTSACEIKTDLGFTRQLTYTSLEVKEIESDYVPFEDLTEEIVLGWVKEKLGTEGVNTIEKEVKEEYEKQIAPPTTGQGLPWE